MIWSRLRLLRYNLLFKYSMTLNRNPESSIMINIHFEIQLGNVSIANDEGITALHNAICAGHYEIVRFLIEQNADVNAPDSDGWYFFQRCHLKSRH